MAVLDRDKTDARTHSLEAHDRSYWLRLLQTVEVGTYDRLVPLDGEDERDVDADARRQGTGDCGKARLGRRDLDH